MEKAIFSNPLGFRSGLGFEKKTGSATAFGVAKKGVLGGIVRPAQSKS